MSLVAATTAAAKAANPTLLGPSIVSRLTATSPPGQPVITPSQAELVTDLIWSLREASLSRKDPNLTAVIETGAVAEVDHHWMRGELASAAAGEAPRQPGAISVAVPRQYRFPAFFIAHVEPPGVESEFLVFIRSDPSEPWQLALETLTRDSERESQVLPQTDAQGYLVSAPSQTPVTPNVPQLFADSWQHWAADGTPPPTSPIAATETASLRGRHLYDRARLERFLGAGDWLEFSSRPDATAEWQVDYPNGFRLVCFILRYTEVRSGSWWRPVDLRTAGPGEPTSGPYLRITTPTLEQDCVSVDPARAAASPTIALIADQVVDEPRSAVPATRPWLPIGLAGLLLTGAVIGLILALRPGNGAPTIAQPVPLRQLTEDGLARAAAAMLAGGLVVAQLMAVLILLHPLLALELAVLVAGWVAWRLIWCRHFRVTACAVLPQSSDEIFDYVADLAMRKDWSTEIGTVEPLAHATNSRGSRFRLRQHLGDGRQIEFVTTVTVSERGRRFVTLIDEPSFRQTTDYTFRTVPTGTEVASSIRVEVGPLRALLGDDLRKAHRKQVAARRAESLERLRLILADPDRNGPPPNQSPGLVLRGPSLLKVSLVATLLTILATLRGWWPLTIGCWIGEGYFVLLCIHEFAHFFVARRLGNRPCLPVLTGVFDAAVQLRPSPATGLEAALSSAAGPVAVALATAASLTLYALYPWPGWLWWAVGASLVTVVGLLPLHGADGTRFLGPSARWFALVGVGYGAGVYVILVLLGMPSIVVAVAAVLALGAGLAPFVRAGSFWHSAAPAVRLVLGLGWLAVFLYVALVAAIGLNWSIPLI